MVGCFLLFVIEILLGLPVLYLSPVLAVLAGMVFLIKAGILSGIFYIPAVAMFLTAGLMAIWPRFAVTMFGVVSAAGFFVPGLMYHYRRVRSGQTIPPPLKAAHTSEVAGRASRLILHKLTSHPDHAPRDAPLAKGGLIERLSHRRRG